MRAPAPRHPILIALLLGSAGFLVNLLRFEIFFNVDFIFGSVFVMLAILLAGPLAGVIAAAIAGSATFLLWNHPWALLIATAEAACAGWFYSRRSWDLLRADLCYWMVLGAPLVWVAYHLALHIQPETTLLIILKQSVNGIVNTLLACLLHLIWRARSSRRPGPRPAFRTAVFVTLVSLVTFPALLFLAAFLRREIRNEEQLLANRSVELDRVARRALNDWIGDHHQAIATLAALVARPDLDAGDRQQATDVLRTASPAFRRVGVLDDRAIVIAYSPLHDDAGRTVLGRDFSDRPYIPILKGTLRPYVADLAMGRIGPPAPIFPLVVPVLRNGRYDGYCIGITDTNLVRELLQTLAGPGGAQLTLLDRKGLIVSTTRTDLPVMGPFRPVEGEARPLGDGVWHRIPKARLGQSRMQRWRHSLVTREGLLGPDLPWKVVVELPFAPLIDSLTRISILGLGALLLLILGTVLLAQGLSRGFTTSIARLEAATRAFPALLDGDPEKRLLLPPSGIEELHQLSLRFDQMTEALRGSFRELRGLKDTLEERVATRTTELQKALDTIRTLQGIIPICSSCKKIRDDQGAWNQLETYISQHTDAAFTHGICPDCAKRFLEEAHRPVSDR
ncbi:MAG TPA: cache domain-containing protein [Holophagaceae bacterium]